MLVRAGYELLVSFFLWNPLPNDTRVVLIGPPSIILFTYIFLFLLVCLFVLHGTYMTVDNTVVHVVTNFWIATNTRSVIYHIVILIGNQAARMGWVKLLV